jgi:hypothetical protein
MVNENGVQMMQIGRGIAGQLRGSRGGCGDGGAVAGQSRGMAGIARDQGRSPDILVANGCRRFPRGVALISFAT